MKQTTFLLVVFLSLLASIVYAEQLKASPDVVNETTELNSNDNLSIAERIEQSFWTWVLGLVLFIFSFPILIQNEFKSASIYRLLNKAAEAAISVSCQKFDRLYNGRLVHMQGGTRSYPDMQRDTEFSINEPNVVSLRRVVEMFQWEEHSRTEEIERAGGEKETRTVYTYTSAWRSFPINSNSFHEGGHHNPSAESWPCSSTQFNADRVDVGAFRLAPLQVQDMTSGSWYNKRDVSPTECKALKPSYQGREWALHNGVLYASERSPEPPAIGDIRVKFEVVRDQHVSIMGQQVEIKSDFGGAVSFDEWAPTWCGLVNDNDTVYDEEKAQLLTKTEVPTDCCACLNLIQKLHGRDFVLYVDRGDMSVRSMLECRASQNHLATWCLRITGYLMMFIGLYFMFNPLITVLSLIPFVGGFLSNLVAFTIWVVCGVSTFVLACVIISIAWIFARPFMTLGLMLTGWTLFTLISLI